MALGFLGLAQTKQMFCAVDVFGFERLHSHADEFCGVGHVFFRQVNVAFLVAAVDASGNTTELQCTCFIGIRF